jgi:hypothetical protein
MVRNPALPRQALARLVPAIGFQISDLIASSGYVRSLARASTVLAINASSSELLEAVHPSAHRAPSIPRQVASPQSLLPFPRAFADYSANRNLKNLRKPVDASKFRGPRGRPLNYKERFNADDY